MSGRKQHFIPQHFQQPFAIKGSQRKIWLYRKDRGKPIAASIADTAAQRDFYSKPSEGDLPTLDDLITEYEQTMHKTVDALRSLDVGEVIDPRKIAEVVTHLAIRSSYMRGMVDAAAGSMVEAIEATAQGNIDGKPIKFPAHKVPSSIEKLILEEFEKRGLAELTPVDGKTISKLLYFALREGADKFLSEARGLLDLLSREFSGKSAQLGHRTQTSVLSESMAPTARIEKLALLDWRVAKSTNGCAILPDSTSIAFDGTEWTSLLFVSNDKLEAVVLPLTPEHLAVGVRMDCKAPDLAAFDQLAAQASHTFFLSSERRKEHDDFLPMLGGNVQEQVSSMTKGAVTQAVDEMLKADPHALYEAQAEHAANKSWSDGQKEDQISFSLQLFDFGDDGLANQVTEAIQPVVAAFSKHLPVHDLKGFVFANDYRAALKSVERGFEAKHDLEPVETENKIGVSMPLSVREDGKVKTLVVSRSSIAVDLISDDADRKSEAVSIILHNLSSAALTSLVQNKFPGQMLAEIEDEYERTLFQYTDGVFSSYFCAAISCSTPSFLNFYEELALEALYKLLEDVPKERRKYRSHGEMEALFPIVAGLISSFMKAISRLLGAQKNQITELSHGSQLWQLLEKHQLLSWFELFQKDLQSFDDGLEAWAHFDEAFFVNRHFERIAVQFSVVPEATDGPGAYVHVPEMPEIDLLKGS